MSLDNFQSLSPAEQEVILNSPALEPPEGVVPNFADPNTDTYRSDIAQFTNALCLILSTAAVLTRAYSRFCAKRIEIEDVLAFAVFGTFIGCVYCNFWIIEANGLFVHQWNVQIRHVSLLRYIFHVGLNLCAVTIMLLKAAILLEWQRLFVAPGTRNYFFWTCRLVLWLHILFHASWVVVENTACTPYRKLWDVTVSNGTCIDVRALYIPAAVINLISNIIILVLPQRVIWGLHTSSKNKLGVSLIFAVGILACGAAAFRIADSVRFYKSEDKIYTAAGMYLWVLAEQTSLYIVFCAPAAPKAFKAMGVKWRRLVAFLMPWAKPKVVRFAPDEPRAGFNGKLSRNMFAKTGEQGISLTQVRSSRQSISESIEQLHRGDGILCTTHVTVEVASKKDEDNDSR